MSSYLAASIFPFSVRQIAVESGVFMTTHRLPGWFYVTALLVSNGVGLIIAAYFVYLTVSGLELLQATMPLSVLIGYGFFNFMIFLTFLYDAWESLVPYRARLSPDKAVWGNFIPFYNFYHICIAVVGLANEINRIREERSQPQDTFLRQIAIAFVGLWLLSSVFVLLIPVLVFLAFFSEGMIASLGLLPLLVILVLVAQVMLILKTCKAINAIAPENHPIGIQKPLLRWSWFLVLAIFVVTFASQLGSTALTDPNAGTNFLMYFGFLALDALVLAAVYWSFLADRKDRGNLIRIGVLWLGMLLLNLGSQQIYVVLGTAGIELGFQYVQYLYTFVPFLNALLYAVLLRFTLRLPLMLLIGAQMLIATVWMVVFQLVISRNGVGDPAVIVESRMISGSISTVFSSLIFLVPLYHGTRKARWDSWRTSTAA
ncbi:MAG: hypothetical protein AAF585_11570 [Verrucomicrobiota bacterium]